jgi:diamine N-acetyltransferase
MTSQSTPLSIRKATLPDISVIQDIAYKTWPLAYGGILSPAQLGYMLELIYSTPAITAQMYQGHDYYIAESNGAAVGFCDVGPLKERTYKLHKLYVLPASQETGAGKALLNLTMDTVRRAGADTLILNVNRHNKAKSFYEKMGFTVTHEEDIDIGDGYFMNDYVMSKSLN